MKLKNWLALLLAVVMVFSCAACTGNDTSSDPVDNTDSSVVDGSSDDASSDDASSDDASSDDASSDDASSDDGNLLVGSNTDLSSKTSSTDSTNESSSKVEISDASSEVDITTYSQEKMFGNIAGTTMKLFTSDLTENDLLVMSEFQTRYDVTVEVTNMSWAQWESSLASLVASGNVPDVAAWTDALFLGWAYGNLAQPINKYMDMSDPIWKDNSDIMNLYKIGNKYYGIPLENYDLFLIYYNATLFEEQKVTDPLTLYKQGNWTFETFLDTAKKMTIKDGETTKTYGFTTWYWQVFILAAGSRILEPKGSTYKVNLQNDAAYAGIDMIRDLYVSGALKRSAQYTDIATRVVAMQSERPYHLVGQNELYDSANMEDELGMVPFPTTTKGGKQYAPALVTTNFIPTGAANPMAGVAYTYYGNARGRFGEETGDKGVLANRRRSLSDEHKKILDDYLEDATIVTTYLEGLSGWGNSAREELWKEIMPEDPTTAKSGAEAAATMESQIDSLLKLTIGG